MVLVNARVEVCGTIPGMFGIFGHGNVAGICQALKQVNVEQPDLMPYYQARNEQAMVHTAAAFMMLAFLVGHLYLSTTGHTPLAHIKAMITGWEDQDQPAQEPSGDGVRALPAAAN